MDPSLIMWIVASVLGVTSMFEVGALVYSVKNLTEEKIRIKITNGIKNSLSDENFQKDLVKMMLSPRTTRLLSDAIMERMKAMFDGAKGYDIKQKKTLLASIVDAPEGDGEVNPLLNMLPAKTREMINKNPQLIGVLMEIGLPLLKDYIGGMMNGNETGA